METSLKYFQNLTVRQYILIALGILLGVILYQFLNGFYTGILMGLGK